MFKLALNRTIKFLRDTPEDKAFELIKTLKARGVLPEGKLIKNLGQGGEGVADLVTYNTAPSGVAAKKYFDTNSPIVTQGRIQIKKEILEKLQDSPNVAKLYKTEGSKPIFYNEYVPNKNRSFLGIPDFRTTFSNNKARLSLMQEFKAKKLPFVTDFSPGHNIHKDGVRSKVIDFIVPSKEDKVLGALIARKVLNHPSMTPEDIKITKRIMALHANPVKNRKIIIKELSNPAASVTGDKMGDLTVEALKQIKETHPKFKALLEKGYDSSLKPVSLNAVRKSALNTERYLY